LRKLAEFILPQGTQWTDQFAWAPISQSTQRTIGGGLVTYSQILYGGRPITIEFPKNHAWLTHTDIEKLIQWASVPEQTFGFQWDESEYLVRFNHSDGKPHEFSRVWNYGQPDNDIYYGTINLLTQ
jgi:hypothetical protein